MQDSMDLSQTCKNAIEKLTQTSKNLNTCKSKKDIPIQALVGMIRDLQMDLYNSYIDRVSKFQEETGWALTDIYFPVKPESPFEIQVTITGYDMTNSLSDEIILKV